MLTSKYIAKQSFYVNCEKDTFYWSTSPYGNRNEYYGVILDKESKTFHFIRVRPIKSLNPLEMIKAWGYLISNKITLENYEEKLGKLFFYRIKTSPKVDVYRRNFLMIELERKENYENLNQLLNTYKEEVKDLYDVIELVFTSDEKQDFRESSPYDTIKILPILSEYLFKEIK